MPHNDLLSVYALIINLVTAKVNQVENKYKLFNIYIYIFGSNVILVHDEAFYLPLILILFHCLRDNFWVSATPQPLI